MSAKKKFLLLIALLATLLAGMSCQKQNAKNSSPWSGKDLYEFSCARCHGKNGGGYKESSYKNAASFKGEASKGLSVDLIKKAMLEGRESMPSFKRMLNEEQIAKVAKYVKGLGGNK